ncbi:hypothetical protein D8M04_11970 [Oceanobacillus piezotolerans]|uniref:PepSY domain-containing protein n=1 Tax=Oceanobacillus piezotolerans TaxID=2448030 RepID=A0A498D6J9_9BACI|nr:PepSY domain-containing protein [Oceanobacillus piezotolerans]RLL43634.1 hypothetical protein D8M04_11970 [Oceanobacillus piezotolerans]
MNTKYIITGLVAAGLLVGGISVAASGNETSTEPIQKAEQSEERISAKQAQEIALAEVEGTIDHVDLEEDDGRVFYEVEVKVNDGEYEIYIDAFSGKVLFSEVDRDDVERKQATNDLLTHDEVIAIAEKAVNGTVKELELDEDDNRYEYEVELRTENGEAEVVIDAVTGDIFEKELD